ncbi:MAG: hypothetical protein KA801_09655 [Syntrophorhabdaceae bacterium]|nr:hypothetical protein [Syntrophorhabdaceae bacterium]
MRHIPAALLAACILLCTCLGYGQALSMRDVSSELEDAFLEKPKAVKSQDTRGAPEGVTSDGAGKDRAPLTESKKWQARLAGILEIPEAPLPEGLTLKILETPGTRFIVAVYNTGEEGVVHKARQIVWPEIRALFAGEVPLIHVVPVSGGTFGAGRTFYTITNERDGFNVLYIPQKAARKVSLAFSGGEGTFLTPDGFVCRIKRYTPDAGGIQ